MTQQNKYCEHCHNGDGDSVYPYVGLAPHVHHQPIGDTEFTNEPLPENFKPDDEAPGVGTYTHCLECSAGSKAST